MTDDLDEFIKSCAQVEMNFRKMCRWDFFYKCEYLLLKACIDRGSESRWTFVGFLTEFIMLKYVSSAHFKVWTLELIDS